MYVAPRALCDNAWARVLTIMIPNLVTSVPRHDLIVYMIQIVKTLALKLFHLPLSKGMLSGSSQRE